MFKKSIVVTIATLFLALLVLPTSEASALTLTPLSREVSLTPGQKSVATVELENEGLEDMQITTEVATFTAKGENGEPVFDFDTTAEIATWIEINEGPFALPAGQKQQFDVVFDTPTNATPGGHYVAVFFNQLMEAAAPGDVNIESKLGTLFLATVKGTYTEQGKIASFSLKGNKTTYTSGPVAFNPLRYQNTGDVHLKPTGKVTIANMFGNTVKTITVNEDGGAALPGTVRQYDLVSWRDIGNAFGKYTATVTLTAGTVKSTATVDFWVLSTLGIVIAVAVLIVLILIIALLISKAGKKSAPAKQ